MTPPIAEAVQPRDPELAPVSDADAACASAREHLLAEQRDDGHWCAELEGDTILESEYILCLQFLGIADERRVAKAANYVRRAQLPEGGWSNYPGGPPEVSVSTKAYLLLKLAGDDPEAPHMALARAKVLELGGIDACNSYTKIYLSIFGQYEWSESPAVPPEMILLPRWFYFNVYAMSSWSRAIVVPLSMIWAHQPYRPLPAHARIDELRRPPGQRFAPPPPEGRRARLWATFFRVVDRGVKLVEAARLRPLRRRALARAEEWVRARLERSDGLGAIFPPIVNTLIAFHCRGYEVDHPLMRGQLEELEKLEIEDDDTLRLQPCKSPVWDTSTVLDALLRAGVEPGDPAVTAAARWLLDRQATEPGDYLELYPEVPVGGGWYFEYANEFYPDCDDTAEVLDVLSRVRFPDLDEEARRLEALDRGRDWLLAMQNDDGGWAAFDKGCDKEILTYIPFADHNAMIDPSTADVTSRALKALRALGFDPDSAPVRRAVEFLCREQEADGSWYGRWGCNYLYGTWLALEGLRASGAPGLETRFARGAEWLRSRQNRDGGWGELPSSYDDPASRGAGPSTASQTAWALLGLFAAGAGADDPAIRHGIDYLVAGQRADGSWRDESWTGTGFPKVFYLRYHLYATYFPLEALAAFCRHRGS